MALLSRASKYAVNPIQEEDEVAMRLIRSGKKVIQINRGDPPSYFKTPKYMIDAFVRALRENHTGYANPLGITELREAISDRYRRLYGTDAGTDKITVTQGVSEALIFLNSMLLDHGDSAVIFKPFYTQYLPDMQFYGGKPIVESYEERLGWNIDTDSLSRRLRSGANSNRIKYMLITNPNNPTGTVLSRKVLEELVDLANEHGIVLVSDEIYDEIVYNGAKFTSVAELAKGVPHVIIGGASKILDATGFRIGFMMVPGEDRASVQINGAIKNLARVRLSANTPAQYAVAEGLRNSAEHKKAIGSMVKSISERVNFASKLINESGYMHTVVPNGAFYLFPRLHIGELKIKDDREFVDKLLKEEYVQLTRGSGFGARNYVRLVALPPKEVLASAIEKMERFCRRHSR
jgi:alanine-synthesizing transaminase